MDAELASINHFNLSGEIIKIYPWQKTIHGTEVAYFILKHQSWQIENSLKRLVDCQVYCVYMNAPVVEIILHKSINIQGFISHNAKKQLIFHISQSQLLS